MKCLLQRFWPPPAHSWRNRRGLFAALGIGGAMLAAGGIVLLLREYGRIGGYVFETRKALPLGAPFPYFAITFLGVWLMLEWVQFDRGRSSLLALILDGDRVPLYSLILASALFSVLWETVNAAHHFWIYTNWPMGGLQLWGVPVTVLVAWPLQYVVFLSLGFLLPRDLWA